MPVRALPAGFVKGPAIETQTEFGAPCSHSDGFQRATTTMAHKQQYLKLSSSFRAIQTGRTLSLAHATTHLRIYHVACHVAHFCAVPELGKSATQQPGPCGCPSWKGWWSFHKRFFTTHVFVCRVSALGCACQGNRLCLLFGWRGYQS